MEDFKMSVDYRKADYNSFMLAGIYILHRYLGFRFEINNGEISLSEEKEDTQDEGKIYTV